MDEVAPAEPAEPEVEEGFIESVRSARREKIERLREVGLDPYPSGPFTKTAASDAKSAPEGTKFCLAGRLIALRVMGNIAFADLHDESGDVQVMLSKKELVNDGDPELGYPFIIQNLDIGDFVWLDGERITTKTGEPTVSARSLRIIAKSLRPLPDKYKGLSNEEVLLRKRYLDILVHPEVQQMIYKKATFWRSIRRFLEDRQFVEVQTPVLEHTTGGADAKPFVTHHNFLDTDVVLRISMGELWQKRLLVAGLERVFEVGRQFRNESQSREHANDYDQVEFYWAYANYEWGMQIVEDLFRSVIQETFGTLQFTLHRNDKVYDIDVGQPWERYDYVETIRDLTGVDVQKASTEEIVETLHAITNAHEGEELTRARAMDRLWTACRKQLTGPGFLINEPIELSPLAKRSSVRADIAERFHVVIAGSELGNGYSELNDPIDQAQRFAEQQRMRDEGDSEAQEADPDFVEALEYGMPPAFGFGMSERVFAFFMDKSVRECQIFPLLRSLWPAPQDPAHRAN